MDVVIFINDYKDYEYEEFNLNRIISSQKHEVESGQNEKELLTEGIMNIDGAKVGYLKYFIKQPSGNFLASRIFFYKDKKLILMWVFDKNSTRKSATISISDCILKSIKIDQ